MFIAALFTMAKMWENPQMPLREGAWINNVFNQYI